MIFDEDSPDVTDTSENENCNKKLIQNDAGSSQDKSYNRYKTHSLDECAETTMKGLRAVPRHLNTDKGKTLVVQPESQKTFNTAEKGKAEPQTECQSFCLCSQEDIWDSEKKNVVKLGVWNKCDHCKKHYELCLNYNSENSSSSWADMMEKDLEWDM